MGAMRGEPWMVLLLSLSASPAAAAGGEVVWVHDTGG
jgi:hypothetical protein